MEINNKNKCQEICRFFNDQNIICKNKKYIELYKMYNNALNFTNDLYLKFCEA